jgi:DNA-binding MarR family transcriptional regulator
METSKLRRFNTSTIAILTEVGSIHVQHIALLTTIALEDGALTITDAARRCGLSQQVASRVFRTIGTPEVGGVYSFVVLAHKDNNYREKFLYITPEGTAFLEKIIS